MADDFDRQLVALLVGLVYRSVCTVKTCSQHDNYIQETVGVTASAYTPSTHYWGEKVYTV